MRPGAKVIWLDTNAAAAAACCALARSPNGNSGLKDSTVSGTVTDSETGRQESKEMHMIHNLVVLCYYSTYYKDVRKGLRPGPWESGAHLMQGWDP